MYKWLTNDEGTEGLLKLRGICIDRMLNLEPDSKEYKDMMDNVSRIDDMLIKRTELAEKIVAQGRAENEKRKVKVDPNLIGTIITGLFSIVGILLITCKEQVIPIASKAFPFIMKVRG